MLQRAFPVVILLFWGAAQAQSPEALDWLRRIHAATHKLSYSGTFVYQQGNRTETSRITHYVDASGEIEGMSYEDIAKAMDCPIGTVRSRIFRAREAIAEQLRPLLGTTKDKRW